MGFLKNQILFSWTLQYKTKSSLMSLKIWSKESKPARAWSNRAIRTIKISTQTVRTQRQSPRRNLNLSFLPQSNRFKVFKKQSQYKKSQHWLKYQCNTLSSHNISNRCVRRVPFNSMCLVCLIIWSINSLQFYLTKRVRLW